MRSPASEGAAIATGLCDETGGAAAFRVVTAAINVACAQDSERTSEERERERDREREERVSESACVQEKRQISDRVCGRQHHALRYSHRNRRRAVQVSYLLKCSTKQFEAHLTERSHDVKCSIVDAHHFQMQPMN